MFHCSYYGDWQKSFEIVAKYSYTSIGTTTMDEPLFGTACIYMYAWYTIRNNLHPAAKSLVKFGCVYNHWTGLTG